MRALREIRAQAAGEPAEEQSSSSFIYGSVSRPPTATMVDVQPLLRAFYNGRDAQLMSGGELHAIVAWLSKQQGYAHADLEDKVLRIRSLGDKKNYLAKHIREQCANLIANEQPEGMCARRPNSCAPYAIPRSAGARYSESRPSSRCSHPEYNAGGQMSQMMYPSLHQCASQPNQRAQLAALPEQSMPGSQHWRANEHEHPLQSNPNGHHFGNDEGQEYEHAALAFQEQRLRAAAQQERFNPSARSQDHRNPVYMEEDASSSSIGDHQSCCAHDGGLLRRIDKRCAPGAQPQGSSTTVRSQLIDTQEQLIEQLRTQVAALTALLHRGVGIPMPHPENSKPAMLKVWYGSGASGQGWNWAIEDEPPSEFRR